MDTVKKIVAIVLAISTLLMCTGCSVSYSQEEYDRYMEDPQAYVDAYLGEDNLWGDILASPLGQLLVTALYEEAKRQEENALSSPQNPSTEEQTPEADEVFLYYDTYGVTDLFDDYDWEYMTRDQNWFMRITGSVSHWLTDAKGKYKKAFRSYVKEFIVDNEKRNSAVEVTFEEEKEATCSFLKETSKALANFVSVEAGVTDILLEYEGMIKTLEKAQSFTEDFESGFADLMERTATFLNENKLKLSVEITPLKKFTGAFKTAGKIAGAVTLMIDVGDCIKTRSDVLDVQKRASEFFEITEIFNKIIEKSTSSYMRDAAEEVLTELQENGYITDLDDLIERKALHAVIDINPIVSVTGGLIDTALINCTDLKDLDTAYSADAIRHIKMACCELLRENTDHSEGNLYYYTEENEEKVNVYLLHCLQSQLFWTYSINDGEKHSSTVLAYVQLSGITLPKVADKYILDGVHYSESGRVHGGGSRG